MKIAIPVLENLGEDSPISEHFGRAPFFAFVEPGSDGKWEITVEANPIVNHGPGDIPNYLIGKGVQVLIVRGIGQRAIYFFNQAGIEVIRGAGGNVRNIMDAYVARELRDREYQVKDKHGECEHH